MKLCSKCRQAKPLTEFHRNRNSKDGLQSRCKPCHIAGVTAAIKKNPKRHLVQTNKYRVNHRELVNAQARERNRRSLKRVLDRDARLNREELRAKAKVDNYYRIKKWHADNPERSRELGRRGAMRHYAAKQGAQGHATTEQIAARWDYYGGRCWICGAPATQTDHVIPLTRGGSDWPSNQRPCCTRCNRSKGNRDHRRFLSTV